MNESAPRPPACLQRQPCRLVLLLQDLEYGGTQRYAINLVKHLSRSLFDPELWVMRGGMDMAPAARKAGISPLWLSRSGSVGPLSLVRLLRLLCIRRPGILYTMTVVPNIWGRLLGKIARVPVIVSGWRSLFPRQHERLLWRLSNRIVCNAAVLRRIMTDLYGVDRDRVAVIPNGVDTELFHPDPLGKSPEPRVLWIGRLVRDKDPRTALEAFRITLERVPGARLLMVGKGPLETEVKGWIRTLGLDRSVTLLPDGGDIRREMRKAWVLALSSSREGSPNVILEAMASGLPVVAPSVGGIPEVVLHGGCGFLFNPQRPGAMARHLTRILEDDSLRQRMGGRANRWARDHFALDRMVRETERVLLETARETGKRGGRR